MPSKANAASVKQAHTSGKRFRVAFSFAGEKRGFVSKVAAILAGRFDEDHILYDKYHEPEFARRDLGIYLPKLYNEEADLIVIVVCADYAKKDWPGLEWIAIHDLLKKRRDSEVMLCRFDRADIEGLFSSAGFVELDRKTPEKAAEMILERLAINEGKPKHHYVKVKAPRKPASGRRDVVATMPAPPAFHAEPPYMGSHAFVGRKAELETIDDWADAADTHPVLLFEAIGGAGKSMLTWQWVNENADKVRTDWAGQFWYSFYERGAIMEDFARRAVAYLTQQPVESLKKRRMPDLSKELLQLLKAKPHLFILDGLERVLVAYHRIDAAQIADEDADTATDQISKRDPCIAIRPEDDQFLRALAAAAPSKILISTRLTPRVLLNPSGVPMPGVQHVRLKGLRPADAEALLCSQGISGDSEAIQAYLKTNCDCHPLVTGVLAGLINDYLPDKGNFDKWAADAGPIGGARLNLADLDLVQRKNNILRAAIEALPEKSRQLLSTLALLSQAADYETLGALNPHLPPEPERLSETVKDLVKRGLLQYDRNSKRHDLHPVVRGVAGGGLRESDKQQYGQRVVDHFSQKPHNPYEHAEGIEDVQDGVQVMRTLMQMGKMQDALDVIRGDLGHALLVNLEACTEFVFLIQPFFPRGWGMLPEQVALNSASYLANEAGRALRKTAAADDALLAFTASARVDLEQHWWGGLGTTLSNIVSTLIDQNRIARANQSCILALNLRKALGNDQDEFIASLNIFKLFSLLGRWPAAETMWMLLNPMGRDWARAVYRPGMAEHHYAQFRFAKGNLLEDDLSGAEDLARAGKDRSIIRSLHRIRGEWRAERGEWSLAGESLSHAVVMARENRQVDAVSESLLTLAQLHIKQLSPADARHEAERLALFTKPADRPLAELWLAIGDRDNAVKHALAAYTWAWADGEPYVRRLELTKSAELLTRLGEPIPVLSPYDPAKDPPFEWEAEVEAAIERLKKENAERDAKEEAERDSDEE